VSSGKSYCQGGLSGIRLILVGREGNHVVERSCFHRSQFGWNRRSPLCLQNIMGLPKAASILPPVK